MQIYMNKREVTIWNASRKRWCRSWIQKQRAEALYAVAAGLKPIHFDRFIPSVD